MVFSSTIFLFRFLPIFLLLYFAVPGRVKNFILFFGSLVFYAWGEPVYVFLMLFSTAADYIHGRGIDHSRSKGAKRFFLFSSVIINLAILGFFKYADFVITAVNGIGGVQLSPLDLPLPIGVSFYTFQTMSYTIDCYRGKVKAQKNLLDFAVYVSMFPQLIAGPIVKYADVERELHVRKPDILDISYGCKRFVYGLAKKVLIANNMGLLWNEITARDPGSLSILSAWMGVLAFAFQIYFDFSGYSDMAIGLGRILGFHFPENFNYPYISTSVTEFWRRWHISLGNWFREYVYIPLGGNRKGLGRQLFNILIVWALTGIWHGAGWNFLLWGLWFALWLVLEKAGLKRLLDALPRSVAWIYNTVVVLVGWVFFGLESSGQILAYLRSMFGLSGLVWYDSRALFDGLEYIFLFIAAALAAIPLWHRLGERLEQSTNGYSIALYRVLEKLFPAVLLIASIAYVVDGTFNPFLYFRF